ncbi:MAG: GxxExxY protein [Opitutaceae bacterium]
MESIYEKSLQHELNLRNVEVRRQVKLQLTYKDLKLDDDYALDLIVDGTVIVELKVVKELAPHSRGATDDLSEANRLQSLIID